MSQSTAQASDLIEGDTIYHTGASSGLTGNTLLIAAAIIGAVLLGVVWLYKKK
jgi:hypothetical protein